MGVVSETRPHDIKRLSVGAQTLEDDDDYYLWDEGGRPCVPAPGARLDDAVQDVLCVPEWQEEGIPTKSKEGDSALPCPALPCPALPSLALPCPALPCIVPCCPALPCPAMSCPAISCPALSFPALPCHALSCPAMSCPAMSCPALPCPALPCIVLCCSCPAQHDLLKTCVHHVLPFQSDSRDSEAKQWQDISYTDKPHKQAMGVLCHSAVLCKG